MHVYSTALMVMDY